MKFHFLRLSGKLTNTSGVSFQKLSFVYEAPAGAFISAKLTFLEISDRPILEKVCISSYLGIFQMTPTAATTRRQFFHLARALAHSGQGWNIPFGNPSLRFIWPILGLLRADPEPGCVCMFSPLWCLPAAMASWMLSTVMLGQCSTCCVRIYCYQ